MDAIVTCVVLALAVAAASFTIARTKVTAPFRAAVLKRSKWFGALVSCPYCVSHWLAAGAVAIYRPRPVEMWAPVDVAVAWMFTVAVSAAVVGVIGRAIAPPPPPTDTSRAATPDEIAEFKRRVRENRPRPRPVEELVGVLSDPDWEKKKREREDYHPDMAKGDPYAEDPRPSRTS